MIIISVSINIFCFLMLLLLTIFMIIHIKYVTPALARELMTVEALGQVLTLPSPESFPNSTSIRLG